MTESPAAADHVAGDRRAFVAVAAALAGVGLTVAHSTAMADGDAADRVLLKQCVLTAVAVGLGCAAAALPPRLVRRLAPWLLAGTVALLIAVLIPGVGVRGGGAVRWLRVAGVSVQPAELAKLAVPLALAFGPVPPRRVGVGSLRRVFGAWPAVLCVGLIAAEPDLSTAVTVLGGAGLTCWLRGWPAWPFLAAGFAALPAAAATLWLRPYQWARVTGFAASLLDPGAAPYQVRQGAVAIGGGGVWGCGLGRGWQKLSFLPEADDDFAFAVVGEELGLVGTGGLLALWAAFRVVRAAAGPARPAGPPGGGGGPHAANGRAGDAERRGRVRPAAADRRAAPVPVAGRERSGGDVHRGRAGRVSLERRRVSR